jgi:hypothetical protein
LNIKPCMGHISGTWELLLREYWRKSMIIGEKKYWQGDWNFDFWPKLGDFIETKAKKSPTSPGLVSPDGWIWIMFCMWLVIIIILDGFLHGNIFKMAAKTRHKKWVKIQHCPISSKFDMWVDNDVPTLKNFYQ